MYRVWLITNQMSTLLGLSYPRNKDLANLALHHDIPEVLIGDIPTPTKKYIESKHGGVIEDYEYEQVPVYRMLNASIKSRDPFMFELLKLADLIEAIHFLTVEGIGDHAKDVELYLRAKYQETMQKIIDKYPQENVIRTNIIYTEIC